VIYKQFFEFKLDFWFEKSFPDVRNLTFLIYFEESFHLLVVSSKSDHWMLRKLDFEPDLSVAQFIAIARSLRTDGNENLRNFQPGKPLGVLK
jgi:hypothetical protein